MSNFERNVIKTVEERKLRVKAEENETIAFRRSTRTEEETLFALLSSGFPKSTRTVLCLETA